MTPRLWGLVALLVIAGLYELWGVLDPDPDDTLSELTKLVFHVSNAVGRWVFIVAWGAFASWFVVHIVRQRGKPKP